MGASMEGQGPNKSDSEPISLNTSFTPERGPGPAPGSTRGAETGSARIPCDPKNVPGHVQPETSREERYFAQKILKLAETSNPVVFRWKAYWLERELRLAEPEMIRDVFRSQDRFTGDTLLHQFARKKAPLAMVRWALRRGADPNLQNEMGETPLVVALKNRKVTSADRVPRELIRFGAKICEEDLTGKSALSLVLSDEGYDAAKELANLSPEQLGVSDLGREHLVGALGSRLREAASKPIATLSDEIQGLVDFSSVLGGELVREVVNSQDRGGLSTLHLVASRKYVDQQRRVLLELGANPNVQSTKDSQVVSNGYGRFRIPSNTTPLHVAALRSDLSALSDFLEFGAESSLKNSAGEDGYCLAFKQGLPAVEQIGLSAYLKKQDKLDDAEVARVMHDIGQATEDQLVEAAKIYSESGQMLHAIYHLRAALTAEFSVTSDAFSFQKERRDALAHLLPHLTHFYDLKVIEPIISSIDETFSQYNARQTTGANRRDKYSGHPYQAEMMAMLGNPRDPNWESATARQVILALRSTGNIPAGQHQVSWQALNNWARIGQLCFSFTKWRFEAMRTPQRGASKSHPEESSSMLERYGFERLDERSTDRAHASSSGFGPGFALDQGKKSFTYWITENETRTPQSFRKKTYVEFRRAYLLVSHPQRGTLIIRNSSPVFGRESLKHAAYWSPVGISKSFSKEEIQSLSANDIEKSNVFYPVVSAQRRGDKQERRDDHIRVLIDELVGLKDDFSAWKFDTRRETAWWQPIEDIPKQLAGGHYSPGFTHLVDFLSSLYEKNKELGLGVVPDLGFVHPDYPAWSPYAFEDQMGNAATRLKVDDQVLSVLQRLASAAPVRNEELARTGVRDFFQNAGFGKEAELVLLAPEA